MGGTATLLHSVPKSDLERVLQHGLESKSRYDDLGLEIRRDVVYCWLRQEHDKLSSGGQRDGYVYVEATVDEDRCRVAEMDFASLAMMFKHGSGGRPQNVEASQLLAKLYEVTSVPLSEYREGVFSSPEVMVKGAISADALRTP